MLCLAAALGPDIGGALLSINVIAEHPTQPTLPLAVLRPPAQADLSRDALPQANAPSLRTFLASVVPGQQNASGGAENSWYPGGTIALQRPHFLRAGVRMESCHNATINVELAGRPDALLHLKAATHAVESTWFPGKFELHLLEPIKLTHKGVEYDGFLYEPYVATRHVPSNKRVQNEVLCPLIPGLKYGDDVAISVDPSHVVVATLPEVMAKWLTYPVKPGALSRVAAMTKALSEPCPGFESVSLGAAYKILDRPASAPASLVALARSYVARNDPLLDALDNYAVFRLIAQAGARCVLPLHRKQALRVSEKGDGSLLTQADIDCSSFLDEGLRALLPGSLFVSEEGASHDCQGDLAWIVDPIDGTRPFATGGVTFAIMVALACRGQVVRAWIYRPVQKSMLWYDGEVVRLDGQVLRFAPSELSWYGSLQSKKTPLRYPLPAHEHRHVTQHSLAHAEAYRMALELSEFFVTDAVNLWDTAAPAGIVLGMGGVVGYCDGTPYDLGRTQKPLIFAKERGHFEQLAAMAKVTFAQAHVP